MGRRKYRVALLISISSILLMLCSCGGEGYSADVLSSFSSPRCEPGISMKVEPFMEYIRDTDSSFPTMKSLEAAQAEWIRIPSSGYSFGVVESPIWLRLRVENPSPDPQECLLFFLYQIIDHIEYYSDNRGLIGITGLRHPSESRFLRDPRFAFPVRLNPGEADLLYFRVDTRFSFAATSDLVHDSGIVRKIIEFNVIWLIYLSMMMVLFLYNLFIYMNARDPLYLYYILFLAVYGFYQFFVMGYAHNFLTDNYYLITVLINSLSQLSLFLHSGYVLRLLEVRGYSPRLDRFIRGFRPLLVLGAVATVVGFETAGTRFNIVTNTVLLIAFYLAALGALRRNALVSMVFLAGWLSFAGGLLVYLFLITGVIPFEESSIRFIHAGNIGEIVAMSFALSLRLRSIAIERAAPEKGGAGVANRAAESADEPPERRSHLKENDVPRIEGALHHFIEEERIYLKEDLKLSLISEMCGFSVHQISEYLNRHLGVNFNDYINERRVRHARELIEKNPSMSLLRIAFDSGFQSKSTFNLAFSRFVGLSPSDFRKKSQKNSPEL